MIPTKPQKDFFLGIVKLFLKFIWEGTDPGIAKTIMKKKNKVERSILADI